MTPEEFDKIENPTYSDHVARYGEWAEFMYKTRHYEGGKFPLWEFIVIIIAVIGFILFMCLNNY
jgi:hypothetical protein